MKKQKHLDLLLQINERAVYFPISFDERRTYGLVDVDAIGLTKENTYKITEHDLGELMGIVNACGDEALVGCKVYHFAKYPSLIPSVSWRHRAVMRSIRLNG